MQLIPILKIHRHSIINNFKLISVLNVPMEVWHSHFFEFTLQPVSYTHLFSIKLKW